MPGHWANVVFIPSSLVDTLTCRTLRVRSRREAHGKPTENVEHDHRHMGNRERRADRARRKARRAIDGLAHDFRTARDAAGVTQQAVALAGGISRSRYNRFEARRADRLTMEEIIVVGDVLGLDVSVRAFPGGSPIRDAGHVALLARFRERIGPAWHWQPEVPIPIPGDLRNVDVILSQSWIRIGVEVETRLRDLQAVEREIALKKRDAECDRMVLLLAATRANRELVRMLGDAMAVSFPVGTRRALAALAAGADPGGDALVLL